ncbi:hypothetical protein PR048_012844 [Dryococelus australis]|uniref:Uncharacterized protein n=1 Tax=Dryococelus australis TaxID=614101 RepID=A0ABQ9HQK5_9NEOP|nr:hypothetical protein PR048_012844 [Dryococelus australis]
MYSQVALQPTLTRGQPLPVTGREPEAAINQPAHMNAVVIQGLLNSTCIDLAGSPSISARSVRVNEVNIEQRWNERAGETGDPQENPPTSSIVQHVSHLRKSGVTCVGVREVGRCVWVDSGLVEGTSHRNCSGVAGQTG